MCLDNIFHFVLYSETKRNALALLSCIYKKKKMIGMEQGVNESVVSQTKVKRGREIFLALLRTVDLSNVGLTGVVVIKSV